MGDYPTSYRGGRSRSPSAGFPSGSAATGAGGAALGGMVSPGAARALRAMGPEVGEAVASGLPFNVGRFVAPFEEAMAAAGAAANDLLPSSAAEALATPVGRTAAAGLFGAARAAMPWLVAGWIAFEIYEWVQARQATSGFSLVARCDHGAHGPANWTYIGSSAAYSSIQVNQVTNCTDNQAEGGPEFVVGPNINWYFRSARWFNSFLKVWRHQMMELWSRTGTPQTAQYIPQSDLRDPWDGGTPVLEVGSRYVDPLAPPGRVPSLRPPLPFRYLPYRQPNPWRDPVEQTERGLMWFPGSRPGSLVEFGVSSVEVPSFGVRPLPREFLPPWQWPDTASPAAPGAPVEVPAPEAEPGPGRAPVPGPGPAPGVSPEPGPGVSPVADPPPIRQYVPEGAFGPTIEIGGGPAQGPHVRRPPGPRVKERKGRYINPGTMFLLRKGAGPLTEGLEVLDCLYKSLPKRVRWKAQQSSWRRQQRYAREHGYKLGHKPNPIQRNDWGQPSIPVPFLPGDQSISVPGGQPRFVDVDLTKHYYTGMSPQEKALAVYRNAHLLDLPSAASCWAANEVEDRIFGGIGRLSAKGARRIRRPVGLQTGPLF